MRIRLRAALVAWVALAATAPVAAVTTPAWATAACGDASAVNRFVEITDFGDPTYSTRATIRDRNVELCSNTLGATSDASAWVMLAGGNPSEPREYTQVGFGRSAGEVAPSLFIQWNRRCPPTCDAANFGFQTWPTMWSEGTQRANANVYNFSSGRIQMYSGNSYLGQTGFDPAAGAWASGWDAQWAGETIDRGDDVPGTSTAKTNFTAAGVKTCRSCGYSAPRSPTLTQSLTVYKFQWVSGTTDFNIWTER